VTKPEVIEAIRQAAAKLGRTPATAELEPLCGIPRRAIRRHFGSLRQAIRGAGFEPRPEQIRVTSRSMLEDWGAVARKLGLLPTRRQYDLAGRFCASGLAKRFGAWRRVPDKFKQFAMESDEEQARWRDMLELIQAGRSSARKRMAERAVKEKMAAAPIRTDLPVFPDRPVFGPPVLVPGLAYEPSNEAGVIYLFGIVGRRLGFHVERLQIDFPDCEAMREIQPGKWQRVRIEFEYESHNFRIHGHPAAHCDLIVCWRHNWEECPDNLEVIELRRAVAGTNE
jgi:hypothetical protein